MHDFLWKAERLELLLIAYMLLCMSSWNTLSVYASENLQQKRQNDSCWDSFEGNWTTLLICTVKLYCTLQFRMKKQDFCFIETSFVLFFCIVAIISSVSTQSSTRYCLCPFLNAPMGVAQIHQDRKKFQARGFMNKCHS